MPVKEIYKILGMSHHTLAPIRRELGLARWPFADICRGEFRIGGKRKSWDDVEDTRKSLMAGADDRIVKILEVMGERALKHKHLVNKVVLDRINKSKRSKEESMLSAEVASSDSSCAASAMPATEELLMESSTNEIIAEAVFSGDDMDWDGLSDLLLRHLDAPLGSLFPPADEIFQ